MKKILLLLLILPFLFFLGCSDDSSGGADLVSEPEADAADDNKATGIYKGVLADTDASGTYKIEITDTAAGRALGDVYVAVLTIEVEGSTMTVNGTATEQADGSYDVSITLSIIGTTLVFDMSVSSTGNVDDLTVTMDGVEIAAVAEKETSTALVEGWEGSFTGSGASGIWNFVRKDNDINGVYSEVDTGNGTFTGSVSGNSITLDAIDYSGTGSGTISGYSITGTWSNMGATGTWKGTRTR